MNIGLTSLQTVLSVTFFVTLLASLGLGGSMNTSHMSMQPVLTVKTLCHTFRKFGDGWQNEHQAHVSADCSNCKTLHYTFRNVESELSIFQIQVFSLCLDSREHRQSFTRDSDK